MAVSAAPQSFAALLAALLEEVEPILISPSANPAISYQAFGTAGRCTGWSFRDVGATVGSNQEVSSSTAVGAAITAVLADTAGEQTFITGFDVTLGIGAAAAAATITVTGITNPLSYDMEVSTTQAQLLSIRFPQPLPGVAITVSVPAVGGVAATNAVTAYGTDSASTGGLIDVFSGHDAGGVYLATISVPAGGAVVQQFGHGQALPFDSGMFLNVVSGKVRGSVWGSVE